MKGLYVLAVAMSEGLDTHFRSDTCTASDSCSDSQCRGSYLLHEDYRVQESRRFGKEYKVDGAGSTLARIRPQIAYAQRLNLTYVCNPLEWQTYDHGTGNIGWMFGCINTTHVSGSFASMASIQECPQMAATPDAGPIIAGMVYLKKDQEVLHAWEGTDSFLRSQWAHVQRSRARVSLWTDAVLRIAITLRLGDIHPKSSKYAPRIHTPSKYYVDAVNEVTRSLSSLSSTMPSQILLFVETASDDPLLEPFHNLSNLQFFTGKAFDSDDGTEGLDRFERDVEHLRTADVLILSGSQFSNLAAGLADPSALKLAMGEWPFKHKGRISDLATLVFANLEAAREGQGLFDVGVLRSKLKSRIHDTSQRGHFH